MTPQIVYMHGARMHQYRFRLPAMAGRANRQGAKDAKSAKKKVKMETRR